MVASALASSANADSLFKGGSEATFVTSNVEILGYDIGADRRAKDVSAGATMTSMGWRASLFVSHVAPRPSLEDDSFRIQPSTFVSARLSGLIAKDTRLSFDVFNVFDQRTRNLDYLALSRTGIPAAPENFLFGPGEPRGFRINLRKTF